MEPLPILLLPGLDGTGRMFQPLLDTAPATFAPLVVSYPTHEVRGYPGLESIVERSLPARGSYAIVAESFGGPLAVRVAAKRPPGLAVSSSPRCRHRTSFFAASSKRGVGADLLVPRATWTLTGPTARQLGVLRHNNL